MSEEHARVVLRQIKEACYVNRRKEIASQVILGKECFELVQTILPKPSEGEYTQCFGFPLIIMPDGVSWLVTPIHR